MAVREDSLSRRERQAMDILYRVGKATAEEVQQELPDQPSYSAVRSLLSILVDKGLLKHTKDSRRYVYEPTVSQTRVREVAVKRLLKTFFDGSAGKLAANLLDPKERKLSAEEVAAIRKLLDQQSQEA